MRIDFTPPAKYLPAWDGQQDFNAYLAAVQTAWEARPMGEVEAVIESIAENWQSGGAKAFSKILRKLGGYPVHSPDSARFVLQTIARAISDSVHRVFDEDSADADIRLLAQEWRKLLAG